MHSTGTRHGVRGFRCYFEYKPVNYRKFHALQMRLVGFAPLQHTRFW